MSHTGVGGLTLGGGNFGIVTEFEFRLHPVDTRALIADFYFPLADAFPVFRRWRDLNAEAPRSATFPAGVGTAGGESIPLERRGTPLAHVGFVWVGDPEKGRRSLPAMRAFGRPVTEQVEELSYLRPQVMDDSVDRRAGRRHGLQPPRHHVRVRGRHRMDPVR